MIKRAYNLIAILVLMESLLQCDYVMEYVAEYENRNPCFNGIPFAMYEWDNEEHQLCLIAILVLMESLLQCIKEGLAWDPECDIAILVLMESLLQYNFETFKKPQEGNRNPCFNGIPFAINHLVCIARTKEGSQSLF